MRNRRFGFSLPDFCCSWHLLIALIRNIIHRNIIMIFCFVWANQLAFSFLWTEKKGRAFEKIVNLLLITLNSSLLFLIQHQQDTTLMYKNRRFTNALFITSTGVNVNHLAGHSLFLSFLDLSYLRYRGMTNLYHRRSSCFIKEST